MWMSLHVVLVLVLLWPDSVLARPLAPALPVLPPAVTLPPVDLQITRAAACTIAPCPPLPSHWYLYRNQRFDRKQQTTFEAPPEGDVFYRVELTTATRSIGIAAANENFNPAMPAISAPFTILLQAVPVRNPTQVKFQCPDHAQDNGHEIDIVNTATGAVTQTLTVGDPAADAQGVVTVNINVQPIAFGTYLVRVRALGGGVASVNSPDSDIWERVPGPPSKPVVQ